MLFNLTNFLKGESDEYDQEFARMREESQKSRQSKLMDELEKAKNLVEDYKRSLVDKKRQVSYLVSCTRFCIALKITLIVIG